MIFKIRWIWPDGMQSECGSVFNLKELSTMYHRAETHGAVAIAEEIEPDYDSRCSSCERWLGHPHAEWCSTQIGNENRL